MVEALMELLDEYYGDCKNLEHKEEICTFIEAYAEDIKRVILAHYC